jgi:hypothetical protein
MRRPDARCQLNHPRHARQASQGNIDAVSPQAARVKDTPGHKNPIDHQIHKCETQRGKGQIKHDPTQCQFYIFR